ncbi:hypothetical protein [Aeromicrobium sp. CF3.5]|uniref:hypothetical protein n=1 Tax=Aeromicrobium sp. CF3.5 TaxID=3373078 RepID=UPI003EE445CF
MSETDEQWRRERREIVRRHHPDRGGDPALLVAELDRCDRRYRQLPVDVTATAGLAEPLRRGLRRATRTARRQVRKVRANLPRRWPGHRRYHDISS